MRVFAVLISILRLNIDISRPSSVSCWRWSKPVCPTYRRTGNFPSKSCRQSRVALDLTMTDLVAGKMRDGWTRTVYKTYSLLTGNKEF